MSAVNHPSHYNYGKLEVIDVIEDWNLDFCLGNAVKYIGRAGRKGDKIEDLEKAEWYIRRAIEHERVKRNEDVTERMAIMEEMYGNMGTGQETGR